MEFFKTPRLQFIKNRNISFAFSGLLLLGTVVSLAVRGPNLSIDFTGGTLIQGYFKNTAVPLDQLRAALDGAGFGGAQIQSVPFHNAVILRYKSSVENKQELATGVTGALNKVFPDNPFEVERVEFVGPVVGRHLVNQAVLAIFFSMLGIALYVAFRFRNLVWGVSGVIALVHDVAIAVGFLSFFQREISITVVAALLTLAGYSINDTIVIFDRIRENLRTRGRHGKEADDALMDRSCNETLSRSVITSLTVFMVLVALLFLGGEVIRDFALTLTIGVVVGSYSTIFVASPIVYVWQTRRGKPLR